jgi:hypothetical protein
MKLSTMMSLCVLVLGAGLAACVNKPGSEANQPEGLRYRDPSLTHSTAQLGLDGPTQIGGPLTQESSLLDAQRLQETTGGGASKQRVALTIGALRAMISAGSDLDAAGIEATFDEKGNLTGAKVARLATSNSAVQRAVNEGAAILVAQWSKATEAERAVLEAQLRAQSETGSTVAQAALSIVTALK